MSIKVKLGDGDGSRLEAHVHKFSTAKRNDHSGLLVLTRVFQDFAPEVHPFLNTTFGAAMNQNISFGSIASIIHDGGSTSSAKTGTADGNTLNELVDSGGGFNAAVVVGMSVHNTTDDTYANVTAVTADTRLTFATDLFPDGNEAYIIDAVWIGTAVQGTWNFADSAKITLTSGDNNDEASIDSDTATSLGMTNFTAFTGKVDLDTYNPTANNIVIGFDLAGVAVGNTVLLNDYIDTGDFSEQSFVIPKDDLGLSTQTINGLTISLSRSGGAKPTFKLDDLQLEASGTPAIFKATTPAGTRFHISELRIAIADNVASTVASGTMHGLAYNALLGVSALSNGIIFQRVEDGKTLFSISIKQLGDLLSTGSDIVNAISDGTNTFLTLLVKFPEAIVLKGGNNDFLSFTINDNLSGLLQFTAAARGAIEV